MEVKREINTFDELMDMCWSGAEDTLYDIQNADKEDEFMALLEMVFIDGEEMPTETSVNDFIWFERDFIYSNIGLTEDGELPEDVVESTLENLELEDDFDGFCGECDECPFDMICQTYEECEQMFEAVKRGDITIDDIRNKM